MNANYEEWQEELLSMDSSQNHKQTLAEIEVAILESDAATDKRFRLRAFWLLRHLAKLV